MVACKPQSQPAAFSTAMPVRRTPRHARAAFTLLELLLALALSVFATAIIASLVQMYSSNFTTRGEDIRRIALARSILNMIADDLRSTVVKQEFDASVLQQMLTGQGGGGGGSGVGNAGSTSGGGPSATGSGADGDGSDTSSAGGAGAAGAGSFGGSQTGSGGQGSSQSGSFGASASGASGMGGTGDPAEDGTETSTMTTSTMPLGIYGSLSSLTIDISRLPRPDEYIAQQTSIMSGQLADVPGDIKSVAYYVQAPTNSGVADAMNEVTSTPENGGMVGGLVRRQIDRAVMAGAEELGQADQLMRTGDLVAPEVVSLEFSYYDGMQWLTDWDSSAQGLPLLVEISLAMQSKSGEKQGIVSPGISISSMPYEEQAAYGIEVYTLTVAIPGALTQTTTAQSADAAAGMEAMGL